jgi:hypothetical protein
VYSAATILIAARKRSLIRAKVSEMSIEQGLQQAIMILERSENPSMSAQQWVRHLQHLRQTSIEQPAQVHHVQPFEHFLVSPEIFGEDAQNNSIQAFTDEFPSYSVDMVGMEDLDWNFLNSAPLSGI